MYAIASTVVCFFSIGDDFPVSFANSLRVYSILGIGLTSSNTGQFSEFFHFHNLLEMCNKAVIKYPTTSVDFFSGHGV